MSENKDNHGFSVVVAQEIGVNRAIMLQHFKHLQIAFLDKEKSAKEVWVKRSRRSLSETYPYFTEKEIRGCLDRLERDEYIRAKVDNALNYDRTKSYQLDKRGWDLMGDPASDKRANRKEKASDKRANGFDERADDNLTKGPMNIGNCSSIVTSFVEGEGTPTPAPETSNLKEEKPKSVEVAPGRDPHQHQGKMIGPIAEYIASEPNEWRMILSPGENPETAKAEKKESPKVAQKGSCGPSDYYPGGKCDLNECFIPPGPLSELSPAERGAFVEESEAENREVWAKITDQKPPGVTIFDGVNLAPTAKEIQPWEHPNPTDPKHLKNIILLYAEINPENWRDNVLESGRATNWPAEKVDECLTDFCAWQFQEDRTKSRLSQYTAGFSLWLKRQPRFDGMAQPGNQSQSRQTPPPNHKSANRYA